LRVLHEHVRPRNADVGELHGVSVGTGQISAGIT